jgi:benzoyl-CoA 2,3-dioxygenase component A
MELGVIESLQDIAIQAGLSWESLSETLKIEGRLHLETY